MTAPQKRVLAYAAVAVAFVLGFAIADLFVSNTTTIDSRTVPTLATVTVSGNGTAYCPAGGAPAAVLPCVNPPTTSAP